MDRLQKRVDVLFELEKYEDVLTLCYENLSSATEDELFYYANIIASYINLQNPHKALESCNEAIGKYPNNAYLFYLKSKIYSLTDKDKLASEAIEYALALAPNDAMYLHQKAKVCYDLSDYVSAKESINSSLELESTNLDAHLTNAKIIYMLDGVKIAKEIVDEILAKDPHHENALYFKQKLYYNIKDKKSILQNLLSFNPQEKEYQREFRFIKYYYKVIPLSMLIVLGLDYLLQSNRGTFGFLEPYVMLLFLVVALVGSNDWRFNLAFVSGVLLIDGWFHYGGIGLKFGDIMAIAFLAPLYTFLLYAMFMLVKGLYLRMRYG